MNAATVDRVSETLAGHARGWTYTPLVGKKPTLAGWTTLPRESADQLRTWAERGNVGVRTGRVSGVVVVDVDADSVPFDLPRTVTAITGSGKRHYYFRAPEAPVKNSVAKLAPGVDVRADGGQVVAVGSLHPDTGKPYVWAPGLSPDDVDFADLPAEILKALNRPAEPASPRPQIQPTPQRGLSRYADAALNREAEAVRLAPEGTRNHTLNRASFNCGQLIAGGEIDRATVENVLASAAASAGLPEGEIQTTLRSGIEAGMGSPRTAPEPRTTSRPSAVTSAQSSKTRTLPSDTLAENAGAVEPPPDEPRHYTDLGNAERFVRDNAGSVYYVHDWRRWLRWDGKAWRRDSNGEVHRLARETVRRMYRDAEALDDDDKRRKGIAFALASESDKRLRAMVALAESDAAVAVTSETFDRDPWLFSVANGTIDLRTGALRPHDPADRITHCLDVEYDPQATCPRWEQFQLEVFDRDFAILDWVQRAVGYTLTGDTREQILLLCYGTGSNGKTTLIETLRKVLGSHAITTSFETLLQKHGAAGGGATEDIARLAGKRLIVANEADAGRRLNESRIKVLTGKDTVSARFLYSGSFDFQPTGKLWLACNHRPIIKGADHAIWRRIKLVPFTKTFEGAQRDTELPDKLEAELPGILAWAVAGCLEWQRRPLGVDVPAAVSGAVAAYRAESDTLGEFLEDRCTLDPKAWVESARLYKVYEAWTKARGEEPLGQRNLAMRLQERPEGIKPDRTKTTRIWVGVSLNEIGGDR